MNPFRKEGATLKLRSLDQIYECCSLCCAYIRNRTADYRVAKEPGVSGCYRWERPPPGKKPISPSPAYKSNLPKAIAFDDYNAKREVRDQNPVDESFLGKVS